MLLHALPVSYPLLGWGSKAVLLGAAQWRLQQLGTPTGGQLWTGCILEYSEQLAGPLRGSHQSYSSSAQEQTAALKALKDMAAQLTSAGLKDSQAASISKHHTAGGAQGLQMPQVVQHVQQVMQEGAGLQHLDMARLLTSHPGLLKVPPPDLIAQLSQLQQGYMEELHLSPEQTAELLYRDVKLKDTLEDPMSRVADLGHLHRVYQDVLGVAPAAALFMSSESRGNIMPDKLQARLQQLVVLMGSSEAAHAAIKKYPQLVAMDSSTLTHNWDQLKHLLGVTDQEMQQLACRSANVLGMSPVTLKSNLEKLCKALDAVSVAELKPIIMDQPRLLTVRGEMYAQKFKSLLAVLQVDKKALLHLAKAQPSILLYSPETLKSKVEHLTKVLDLDESAATKAIVRGAFMCNPSTMEQRVPQIALQLKVQEGLVRRAVAARPTLLSYHPDTLGAKVKELAQLLQVQEQDVAAFCMAYPLVLIRKPGITAEKALKLGELISTVPQWSSIKKGHTEEQLKLLLLRYAMHGGARTISRMQYLLQEGLQDQEKFHAVHGSNAEDWAAKYPAYCAWLAFKSTCCRSGEQ